MLVEKFYYLYRNFFIKGNFKRLTRRVTHGSIKEVLWTLFPSLILIAIAIPSIELLYSMDATSLLGDVIFTFKIIGHQWFWSYEYFIVDQQHNVDEEILSPLLINYTSYMLDEDTILKKNGGLRLLEVDNALFLPILSCVRFLITSVDVLHAWAVPSLGVKVDAVPGRLNQAYVVIKRPGEFYGQCSEICGVNHGFMPIKVVAFDYNDYLLD